MSARRSKNDALNMRPSFKSATRVSSRNAQYTKTNPYATTDPHIEGILDEKEHTFKEDPHAVLVSGVGMTGAGNFTMPQTHRMTKSRNLLDNPVSSRKSKAFKYVDKDVVDFYWSIRSRRMSQAAQLQDQIETERGTHSATRTNTFGGVVGTSPYTMRYVDEQTTSGTRDI